MTSVALPLKKLAMLHCMSNMHANIMHLCAQVCAELRPVCFARAKQNVSAMTLRNDATFICLSDVS